MFEVLREAFPLDETTWQDCVSRFHRLEASSKTVLLKEGEVSKKLFLIEEGCVRAWFNNNGADLTLQFFFEHDTVASIESFKKANPSQFYLETIEPSVLWYLHKEDVYAVIAQISEVAALRNKLLDAVFQRTFDYMKHFLSFIKDTPQERYANLLHERPDIIRRVPQHYIASYLGISTVHLSRIKSKLLKETKSHRVS